MKTMMLAIVIGMMALGAQAASIVWGSTGTTFRFYDNAGNLINHDPTSGFVQLIYTSSGTIGLGTEPGSYSSDIDMGNAAGGYVTGDNVVISSMNIGDGIPSPPFKGRAEENYGYMWGNSTDAGGNVFTQNDQFFIRIWDSADPASATYYNQTGLYTLTATDNSGSDNFLLSSNLNTTQPVPEPGTIMLALAGAGAFLAKRRKTKKSA